MILNSPFCFTKEQILYIAHFCPGRDSIAEGYGYMIPSILIRNDDSEFFLFGGIDRRGERNAVETFSFGPLSEIFLYV